MEEKPKTIHKNVFDYVIDGMNNISGVILIFVMLLVGLSVFLRYFFMRPIGWAQEISEYSLVCITFLSIAWVLREEGHVSMDLLFHYFKPRTKALFNVITSSVCVVVCCVLAYSAMRVAVIQFEGNHVTYTVLALPKYIFSLIIMMGFIMVILQFIRRVIKNLKSWKAQEE